MRNLVVTLSLLMLSTLMFAQNITISIVGLNQKDPSKEVVFKVKSAELVNNIDGRTNQVINQKIEVEKVLNSTSDLIKEAAEKGRLMPAAKVIYKSGSQTVDFDLSDVLISNFSWKLEEGKPMLEYFTLAFKTIY